MHGMDRPLQNRNAPLAVGFVEAARFWGGQHFVRSRTKLSDYRIPLVGSFPRSPLSDIVLVAMVKNPVFTEGLAGGERGGTRQTHKRPSLQLNQSSQYLTGSPPSRQGCRFENYKTFFCRRQHPVRSNAYRNLKIRQSSLPVRPLSARVGSTSHRVLKKVILTSH